MDYSRQISLLEIGPEGQKRLEQSSVAVIGIGGLGCAALPYLAAAGIHRLGLIDFDRVEASNLHRQILFGPADIGKYKVEAAISRLSLLYPQTLFNPHILRFEDPEVLRPYDLILDATDNADARYAINDACRQLQKPWVYGSIHQWEGQAALFIPNGPDYRDLFPNTQNVCNCSTGGVLGPFVGAIGAIQALEAIKWLAGLEETLAGKLLCVDAKTWRTTVLSFSDRVASKWEMTLDEYQKLQEPIQLIDVREPSEKAEFDLGGESNPYTRFSVEKLDKTKINVLYCRSGKRSGYLAQKLQREGYNAFSLIRN